MDVKWKWSLENQNTSYNTAWENLDQCICSSNNTVQISAPVTTLCKFQYGTTEALTAVALVDINVT